MTKGNKNQSKETHQSTEPDLTMILILDLSEITMPNTLKALM